MTAQQVIPKNDYYAGFLYNFFFDPFTNYMRDQVSACIPQGATVLDVGSGTGYQLLKLAPKIKKGVGVDLSNRMIDFARKEQKKRGVNNLAFGLANAADLSQFKNNEFDISAITLVLHEMKAEYRQQVVNEMARVSKRVLIADYAPVSGTGTTVMMHLMENTLGILHYHLFLSYRKNGAAPALIEKAGMRIIQEDTAMLGMVRIWTCEKV